MRVVLVTGIFPPDIGGPATHTADLRDELTARGHEATVVTLWDGPELDRRPGIVRFPRRWPWPAHLAAVAAWLVDHRSEYDAVYATGLQPAAVAGARIAGRPVVVKVVGDAAWERGRRLSLTDREFDSFQAAGGGPVRLRAMRWLQNWSLRKATFITAPSEFLAGTIDRWLQGPAGVRLIPNGVRVPDELHGSGENRDCLRTIYVGRLVAHKRVEELLAAVARTDQVRLEVVGGGPERPRLERKASALGVADRVVFRGELPHDEVLCRIADADALMLASDYEGLPHVVIEAMVCGTPVVSPAVGGVREVIRHGENGLIVEPSDADGIAVALERLRDDGDMRERLSDCARKEGQRWRIESSADQIERLLACARRGRPRVVFLGKTRVAVPLEPELRRKLEILVEHLEPTLLTVGRPGVRSAGRARVGAFPDLRPPLLGGMLFYSAGPLVAVWLTAGRRRAAIVCQSPYEGFGVTALASALPRAIRPRVVIEAHGDWHTAARLYGSPGRRAIAPLADRMATWALRRADRVRVASSWLAEAVRNAGYTGQVDRFPGFSDFSGYLDPPVRPLPSRPSAVFVGGLESAKGVDVLVQAWTQVVQTLPAARLVLVGAGSMREAVQSRVRDLRLGHVIRVRGHVSATDVRQALDDASCLVLPSRSEGLGRVILEAMARGRPVIATKIGGIPELVDDGITGLLVPPENPFALAESLIAVLSDRDAPRAMGAAARRRVEAMDVPGEYRAGIARLAAWVDAG